MIITGVVVNRQEVTLYDQEGNSHRFPQGHAAIPYIVNHIIPELGCNNSAEFLWEEPEPTNEFKEFEKKSKLVKFFSVGKKKLAEWLGTNSDKEPDVELVPRTTFLQQQATSVADKAFDPKKFHSADSIDLNADNSMRHEKEKEETIVAVVGDKLIPDAERLQNHLMHSNEHGNVKNVEAFLKLISEVIDKRKHSVEDLLRFIQLGDLPIADDGYIVGYKALCIAKEGVFKDAHTGKVLQKVGDIVQVPVHMVDDNRRRACSNGLHFARRSYLSSFGCQACVLVRVHPADFIAVPEGDASKCRVAKYHIVGEISAEGYYNLKEGKSLDRLDAKLLAMALSGKVPAPQRIVTINGDRGENITVENLGTTENKVEEPKVEPVVITEDKAPIVPKAPEEVVKTPVVKVAEIEKKKAVSHREHIKNLINKGLTKESAQEIEAIRKKCKKSLIKLGVSVNDTKRIKRLLK